MSDSTPSKTSSSPASAIEPRQPTPRLENVAFREQARHERDEIASRVELARTTSDVPALLRLLIAEIYLWTRELKHETFALFEETEYGRLGRQMMRGRPESLSIVPGYVVLGFMVAPDAHDLVELAVGESQAQSLARRFEEFDNHRREFGEAVAQLASTWDGAQEKNYNQFALIDRRRSELKLIAFDLCRYIDTLANLVTARRSVPSKPAPTERTQSPGDSVRSAAATTIPEAEVSIAKLDGLLDDATNCLMSLAAIRQDMDVMSRASSRMEGGGEDWHFANRADEGNYRDAERRAESNFALVTEPLNRLLAWGLSRDLEVSQDCASFKTNGPCWRKADDCDAYERDVRTIMNSLIIEKAKSELTTGVETSARRDPLAVWRAAETMKGVALQLLNNAIMLRIGKPSDYDDRDKMNRDSRLARKHGYLLASVARKLSLDSTPFTRILREDRLWEHPVEKEDAAVFSAAADLAEKISVEAHIWCAEAGIDPQTAIEDRPVNSEKAGSGAPAPNSADADQPGPAGREAPPGAPAGFADSLKSGASPNMPAGQWRNAGLGLLMLLAQAYYKMLEGAISMASWCTALDLELNHSYLWTTQNLSNLLKNHEALRDFPVAFEPLFPDLYPSTIRDVDWDDMVAPDAERFLSTVQQYVFSKGFAEPEKGSQDWVFIELFRPTVTGAIEHAVNYAARMKQHARRVIGPSSAAASTTSPNPESSVAPVPTEVSSASESSASSATDVCQPLPFEIDESAFKVVMNGHARKFTGRSKKLFALLVRISRRPGHQVPFDSLRQTGDVWDGCQVEDSTIKGAVSRLRDELRAGGMSALATAIRTGTLANRSFVILEPEGLFTKSN